MNSREFGSVAEELGKTRRAAHVILNLSRAPGLKWFRERRNMPGIILSLVVTLIALSFAFYRDDAKGREEWRDSAWHSLRKTSPRAEMERKAEPPSDPEHPGSIRV